MNKNYLSECENLKKQCLERRELIFDKYKNEKIEGLDGNYKQDRELNVITRWFTEELDKLKKKYGV